MMGAAKHIKTAMTVKGIKSGELAALVGKTAPNLYNILSRDVLRFSEVEAMADALGCDVVLRDRETGRFY